jgi:superfamily I DNA/RNA helicase
LSTFDNQYCVIGPPGCGKTHYVARQVEHATERHGVAGVMVCSLTRTAAREAAGRVNLPEHQVGTLHAMAYRALGYPSIAEGSLGDWNAYAPEWAIGDTGTSDDMDGAPEQVGARTLGERSYQDYSYRRARLQPQESWPTTTQAFAHLWEKWKNENGQLDFQDLIDVARRDCPTAPGRPAVIFFDEAQDASKAEVELLKRWGAGAEQVVTVGDEDQALYVWRGAMPEAMFPHDTPSDRVRVLSRSYRVPAAIHSVATEWIGRMRGRRHIDYKPRDDGSGTAPGEVRTGHYNHRNVDVLLDDIGKDLTKGYTVMIQTACGYMLESVIRALRRDGIPFHNPWRPRHGAWNPLARRKDAASMADRLAAWAHADDQTFWTARDVRLWGSVLRSEGVMLRGGKKIIEKLSDEISPVELARTLRECFEDGALKEIAARNTLWWRDNIVESKSRAAEYPCNILTRRGRNALVDPPKVIVGTIHSLKGSEADSVYLFPDVSNAGWVEWSGAQEQQAGVFRLFYVGLTRAREKLTLCEPCTRMAVDIAIPAKAVAA